MPHPLAPQLALSESIATAALLCSAAMSYTYDNPISANNRLDRDESVAQATARTRQWCERVAHANKLNAEQLDDLKQLVNVSDL